MLQIVKSELSPSAGLGLLAYAMLAGALTSFGYAPLVVLVAIPAIVIVAVAILGKKPHRTEVLAFWIFSLYLVFSILWPRYVALWIPGMPSLNPPRLLNACAVLLLAILALQLKDLRSEILNSISRHGILWVSLVLYAAFRFFSICTSKDLTFSVYQLANEFFVHIVCVFMGVYIGSRPAWLRRITAAIPVLVGIAAVIAIVEWRVGHNLFSRFVDPTNEYVRWALSDKTRGGAYRAQGTFGFPITLAEFMIVGCALSYNSYLGYAAPIRGALLKYAVVVLLASLALVASGSRSGYAAFALVMTLVLSAPLLLSIARGRISLALAAFWSMFACVFLTILYFAFLAVVDQAFGANSDQASNALRESMLRRSIALFWGSPILGYGPGRAPEVIGVHTSSGQYTVDSFILTVLVESGGGALAAFLLTLCSACAISAKKAVSGDDNSSPYWWSLTVSIVGFLVFLPILSLLDNHYLLYFLIGLIVSEGRHVKE